MSDMQWEKMPFGKYEGRTLREVLELDEEYVEWLFGQNWFEERYPKIAEYFNTAD